MNFWKYGPGSRMTCHLAEQERMRHPNSADGVRLFPPLEDLREGMGRVDMEPGLFYAPQLLQQILRFGRKKAPIPL